MELNDLYVNTLINTIAGVSADIKELTKELKELSENSVGMVEYDGKSYTYLQHQQIVKGLEEGIDVSLYDNPEFDDLKMTTIRSALNRKVQLKKEDLTPSYDLPQLFQVIRSKQSLLNCPLLSPSMPADVMAVYITACEKGVDITPYLNEFDSKRLEIILNCLVNNYDVNKIAVAGLSYEQMQIVYNGLERNLDVTQYNNAAYTEAEMQSKFEDLLRGQGDEEQLYSLSYYCLPSDTTSVFTNEFADIESAIEFRKAKMDGSIGVIYHNYDLADHSPCVEKYQLLNIYQEVNYKSLDKMFDEIPVLKYDKKLLAGIEQLMQYSGAYVPLNIKEKYLAPLYKDDNKVNDSIGGNKR